MKKDCSFQTARLGVDAEFIEWVCSFTKEKCDKKVCPFWTMAFKVGFWKK